MSNAAIRAALRTLGTGLLSLADAIENQEPAAQPARPVSAVTAADIVEVFQPAAQQTRPVAAVTAADVVEVFQRLFSAKGEGAVIELLRQCGINRISEANGEQLAWLRAAAQTQLDQGA